MNNKYINNVVNSVGSLDCGNVGNAWFHHGLEPWFVTGLVDGEGCFSINVTNSDRCKTGFKVELFFAIGFHKKDKVLLERIRNFFGVGSITKNGAEAIQYRVSSIKDLAKILDHFDKYPLLTQKLADYELFKQAFKLMERGEHLTLDGLNKIVAIKASMNRGLSEKLKLAFPDVVPVIRPLVKNQTIKDPNWLAGFTSGEGSFMVIIAKSNTKIGFKVQLVFSLTQHSRDENLMRSLIEEFNCGNVVQNRETFDFNVTKFPDLENKIIPFYKNNSILGVKALDFNDFCRVAEMMKEKKHLTIEGLEQIKKIKAGMNNKRITE